MVRFWTFIGTGPDALTAIQNATEKLNKWLETHTLFSPDYVPLFGFFPPVWANGEPTCDFVYIVTAWGQVADSDTEEPKPSTDLQKDAELGALVRKIPYGCYLDHSGIKPLEWSCVLPGITGRSETPEGALTAALEQANG